MAAAIAACAVADAACLGSASPAIASPPVAPARASARENVLRQLAKVDVGNTGIIPRAELCLVFKRLGPNLTQDKVEALLDISDGKGGGYVRYHEFVDWVFTDSSSPPPSHGGHGLGRLGAMQQSRTVWPIRPHSAGQSRRKGALSDESTVAFAAGNALGAIRIVGQESRMALLSNSASSPVVSKDTDPPVGVWADTDAGTATAEQQQQQHAGTLSGRKSAGRKRTDTSVSFSGTAIEAPAQSSGAALAADTERRQRTLRRAAAAREDVVKVCSNLRAGVDELQEQALSAVAVQGREAPAPSACEEAAAKHPELDGHPAVEAESPLPCEDSDTARLSRRALLSQLVAANREVDSLRARASAAGNLMEELHAELRRHHAHVDAFASGDADSGCRLGDGLPAAAAATALGQCPEPETELLLGGNALSDPAAFEGSAVDYPLIARLGSLCSAWHACASYSRATARSAEQHAANAALDAAAAREQLANAEAVSAQAKSAEAAFVDRLATEAELAARAEYEASLARERMENAEQGSARMHAAEMVSAELYNSEAAALASERAERLEQAQEIAGEQLACATSVRPLRSRIADTKMRALQEITHLREEIEDLEAQERLNREILGEATEAAAADRACCAPAAAVQPESLTFIGAKLKPNDVVVASMDRLRSLLGDSRDVLQSTANPCGSVAALGEALSGLEGGAARMRGQLLAAQTETQNLASTCLKLRAELASRSNQTDAAEAPALCWRELSSDEAAKWAAERKELRNELARARSELRSIVQARAVAEVPTLRAELDRLDGLRYSCHHPPQIDMSSWMSGGTLTYSSELPTDGVTSAPACAMPFSGPAGTTSAFGAYAAPFADAHGSQKDAAWTRERAELHAELAAARQEAAWARERTEVHAELARTRQDLAMATMSPPEVGSFPSRRLHLEALTRGANAASAGALATSTAAGVMAGLNNSGSTPHWGDDSFDFFQVVSWMREKNELHAELARARQDLGGTVQAAIATRECLNESRASEALALSELRAMRAEMDRLAAPSTGASQPLDLSAIPTSGTGPCPHEVGAPGMSTMTSSSDLDSGAFVVCAMPSMPGGRAPMTGTPVELQPAPPLLPSSQVLPEQLSPAPSGAQPSRRSHGGTSSAASHLRSSSHRGSHRQSTRSSSGARGSTRPSSGGESRKRSAPQSAAESMGSHRSSSDVCGGGSCADSRISSRRSHGGSSHVDAESSVEFQDGSHGRWLRRGAEAPPEDTATHPPDTHEDLGGPATHADGNPSAPTSSAIQAVTSDSANIA